MGNGIGKHFFPFFSCCLENHRARREAECVGNEVNLMGFVVAREERLPGVKLDEDTTKAPHVDRQAIPDAQKDFRGAIEATLNIAVTRLPNVRGGRKIDNFDRGFAGFSKQNVFRFEITMYNAHLLEKEQSEEDVLGKEPNDRQGDAVVESGADDVKETHRELFKDKTQMGLMHEMMEKGDDGKFAFFVGF